MKNRFSNLVPSGRWLATLLVPAAVVLSEAASWWWMNPSSAADSVEVLSYRFPAERRGYQSKALEPQLAKELHFDVGQNGRIDLPGQRCVDVSFFEWNGTDRQGLKQACTHKPDVCMGVNGFRLEKVLASRRFSRDGQDIVFDATFFRNRRGDPIFVFKTAWAEGMGGINLLRDGPMAQKSIREFKIQAVQHRWKPRAARVLMGVVAGCQEEESAWNLVCETVLKDLKIEKISLANSAQTAR